LQKPSGNIATIHCGRLVVNIQRLLAQYSDQQEKGRNDGGTTRRASIEQLSFEKVQLLGKDLSATPCREMLVGELRSP
jgi:hypothetical protein